MSSMNIHDFLLCSHVCPAGRPQDWGTLLSPYMMNGALWLAVFQDGTTKRIPVGQFEKEGWWRSNNGRMTWLNVKGEIVA